MAAIDILHILKLFECMLVLIRKSIYIFIYVCSNVKSYIL